MNVQSAKLGEVLSVKSVTVVTICINQTQRIIGLITTSSVTVLENVYVGARRLHRIIYEKWKQPKLIVIISRRIKVL